MFDAVAGVPPAVRLLGLLVGIEGHAHSSVADRVDVDLQTGAVDPSHDLVQLLLRPGGQAARGGSSEYAASSTAVWVSITPSTTSLTAPTRSGPLR